MPVLYPAKLGLSPAPQLDAAGVFDSAVIEKPLF